MGEDLQKWQVMINPSDERHTGSKQEPSPASSARVFLASAPKETTSVGRMVSALHSLAIKRNHQLLSRLFGGREGKPLHCW